MWHHHPEGAHLCNVPHPLSLFLGDLLKNFFQPCVAIVPSSGIFDFPNLVSHPVMH